MKIALLISGSPRTFILKEQISFFENFLNNLKKQGTVDIFILLKLNDDNISKDLIFSQTGIKNLDEMVNVLNPKYIEFFNSFETKYLTFKYECFFSQITMIDNLIKKTEEFDNYDMFIRIRPDCIVSENINFSLLDKDVVYTMKKCDSRGHDCMFIFNKNVLEKWWIKKIRVILNNHEIYKHLWDTPDYAIFNIFPTVQFFNGGIIRDYGKIVSWIDSPGHILEYLTWNYYENYLELKKTLDFDIFIQELSKKYTFKNTLPM
jgi:hypothetical protein